MPPSRGYCLGMICADFLSGANLDNGDPETLLFSMTRFFKFLRGEQRRAVFRTRRDQNRPKGPTRKLEGENSGGFHLSGVLV